MRALVTGATGFIGRHLCSKLREQGYKVRALALPGEDVRAIAGDVREIRRGDLREPGSLSGIADGVDLVFHLAARVVDHGSRRAFYSVIYDGTGHLLDAVRGEARRFVFVSSMAACGLGRHLKGRRESDPAEKSGVPYNDAKLDAEERVRASHGVEDMETVIVRPANVVGPGSVWVTEPVQRFLQPMSVPLIDGGRHSASLLSVHSLADGLLLAGTLPAAAGKTYFFRDDWPVSWQRYLTDLGAVVGREPRGNFSFAAAWSLGRALEILLTPLGIRPPITRLAAAVMGRDNDVDTTAARTELGWETAVSYEQAMDEISRWVRAELLPRLQPKGEKR